MRVAVPDLFLRIFGLAATEDVWVRILGTILIALGYYYVDAARVRTVTFMRATVVGRAFVAAVLFALAALGLAPPVAALFGVGYLAAAAWTAYALRSTTVPEMA